MVLLPAAANSGTGAGADDASTSGEEVDADAGGEDVDVGDEDVDDGDGDGDTGDGDGDTGDGDGDTGDGDGDEENGSIVPGKYLVLFSQTQFLYANICFQPSEPPVVDCESPE
jgi:hypothetical protein